MSNGNGNDNGTPTDYKDMVAALVKPGLDILLSLTPEKCNLWHMATGVSGEAGELLDAIKKHVAYGKELDRTNVIEELGDLEFYIEGIRQELDISREETLTANMEKLLLSDKARYKLGKYTDQQAQDRADKAPEQADMFPLSSPPPVIEESFSDFLSSLAQNRKPTILILGHGRHGKDTVAEMLAKLTGLRFLSSSEFCAEHVVYPKMRGYIDWQSCYKDGGNHRTTWFNAIAEYNTPDRTRLAREILKVADIYVGMRNIAEYTACMEAKLFDYVIWVDASDRVKPEPATSFTIPYDSRTMIKVDNNGDLYWLKSSVLRVCKSLGIFIPSIANIS